MGQKYFRKAAGVPVFLWRCVPDEAALAALPEAERFGPETSAKQVFDRLASTWTYWASKGPNSPQWFNTGLHRSTMSPVEEAS